jgi:hypothetical protein
MLGRVRFIEDTKIFVKTMPKTPGVADELYGMVVGMSGPYTKEEFILA